MAADHLSASQKVSDMQEEYAEMKAANAALEEDIAYLKTEEGIRKAAQELGWTSEGEQSLRVSGTGQ